MVTVDHPGCRFAVDVVQCGDTVAVEKAVHFVLGRTLICETLEEARAIAFGGGKKGRKTSEGDEGRARYKLVTIEGQVISKAGLMTGGNIREEKKGRWDQKTIAKLKKKKTSLLETIGGLRERQFALEAREGEEGKALSSLEGKREYTVREQEHTETVLRHYEDELRSAAQEAERVEKEERSVEARHQKTVRSVAAAQQQLAASATALFASLSKKLGVADIHSLEEGRKRKREEGEEKITSLTIALEKLTHQLRFARHRAEGNREEEAKERRKDAEKEIKTVEKELNKVTAKAERLQANVEEGRREAAKLREEYLSFEGATKLLRHQLEGKQEERQALGKRLTAEEAQLERLCGRRHDSLTKGREEELITLPKETISKERGEKGADQEGDSQEQREAVYAAEEDYVINYRDVEKKYPISSLGEYQTLLEQFDKDQAHYESLIAALTPNLKATTQMKGALQKVENAGKEFEETRKEAKDTTERFERLKAERKRLFQEAFEHISGVIDRIYKRLTRTATAPMGGQAYLTLENTEEPYNGGVQYTATPPAKRFHEIGLLSGGEKTMAALALLFAVHSYHPSPFFVLDEVDAALDNDNVAQVARYVREQSRTVQFIVISLKDTLYSHADALVGIARNQSTKSSVTYTFDLSPFANN
jgi:structural maintenance of chromosome 1